MSGHWLANALCWVACSRELTKQFSLAVILLRQLERNWDIRLADGVVPYALAVGSILIQRLIDYIPSGAVTLPPASNSLDVVLHNLDESGVGEITVRNPERKLRVPNKGVAVDLELVLARKCDMAIGIRKGEISAGGFRRLPLHCILWRHGVELLLDDLGLAGFVAKSDSSTDEAATALLHSLIEAVVLRLAGRSDD